MKSRMSAWMIVVGVAVLGPASAAALHGDDALKDHPSPADSSNPSTPVTAPKAEVIVLYGSNDGTGIDANIGKIPALEKPPFSSYDSYKLLDRQEHALTQGQIVSEKLPDTNTLEVTLKDVIQTKPRDANEKPETRYLITTSIQKPDGKGALLPNLEVSAKLNEYFFVGGPKYKDGALVIGIRVR